MNFPIKAKLIDSSVKASSGNNTNTVTWKWDDKEAGPERVQLNYL